MKIVIGSDHAGFDLKEKVIKHLEALNHEVEDYGTHSGESVDYPDFAHPVSSSVNDKKAPVGILICGSGNGVNMTANKYPNVRSALCWTPEISTLARLHNDANICAIPARFLETETAFEIVDNFLASDFEGGRHQRRVDKIISC